MLFLTKRCVTFLPEYWNRRQRNTEKAERSEAIDFRQGGRDRSSVRINFAGIKRYFRQRRSGRHACIRSLQQWTGAAATASAQQARAGWWPLWGQSARSAAERRKHRRLQVLSLRPEPSRVDMQVQAVRMSRMPQKGSSQVNVPQQSQVPRRANVRGRGRRGRDFRHLSHKHSSEGKQRAMVNNNGDRPSSCKNGN